MPCYNHCVREVTKTLRSIFLSKNVPWKQSKWSWHQIDGQRGEFVTRTSTVWFPWSEKTRLSSLVHNYGWNHKKQSGKHSTAPTELLIVTVVSVWQYQRRTLVCFFSCSSLFPVHCSTHSHLRAARFFCCWPQSSFTKTDGCQHLACGLPAGRTETVELVCMYVLCFISFFQYFALQPANHFLLLPWCPTGFGTRSSHVSPLPAPPLWFHVFSWSPLPLLHRWLYVLYPLNPSALQFSSTLTNILTEIKPWMQANFLKLNCDKSDMIIICP